MTSTNIRGPLEMAVAVTERCIDKNVRGIEAMRDHHKRRSRSTAKKSKTDFQIDGQGLLFEME
jgi:hypothetical protein